MAKRPQGTTPGKTTGKGKAKTAAPGDPRDAVIDAAMARIARDGWRRLSLADVAADAGVPLADVLIPFPTKYDIVNAFQDRIDAQMLTAADTHAASGDAGVGIRDRLFDLLMERFDALTPHRAAMAEIAKDSLCDPAAIRQRPWRRSTRGCAGPRPRCGFSAGSARNGPPARTGPRPPRPKFYFIALQYKA